MRRIKLSIAFPLIVCVALLASSGCKTEFYGSPKVPGGAQGCAAVCSSLGMDLAGMVVMGEYSDGCICAVPGREHGALLYVGATGAGPAAVGVMSQMDDEQAQRDAAASP